MMCSRLVRLARKFVHMVCCVYVHATSTVCMQYYALRGIVSLCIPRMHPLPRVATCPCSMTSACQRTPRMARSFRRSTLKKPSTTAGTGVQEGRLGQIRVGFVLGSNLKEAYGRVPVRMPSGSSCASAQKKENRNTWQQCLPDTRYCVQVLVPF